MKKIYISMIALVTGMGAMAQSLPTHQAYLSKTNTPGVSLEQSTTPHSVAAAGDTINNLVYDMSTPANWTLSNTSSPSYDWEFVTGMPANITDLGYDATLNSETNDNFALANSDGQGNGTTQNCILQLANPVDMTGQAAVALAWTQYYRVFTGDAHYVEYSTNGTDWTSIQVNGEASASASDNPEYANVVLGGAANQPQVWIRFRFEGAWGLFWSIDDVAFVEAPSNDLTLSELIPGDVINDYLYSHIPVSQATEVILGAVVTNSGAVTQNNVDVEWEVTMDGSSVASGTEETMASIAPGETDTVYISTGYTPAATGELEMTASVSADETEEAPEDNEGAYSSTMYTDYVWAHDYPDAPYFELGYDASEPDGANGFEMGADYFCQVDGNTIYALQFALGTSTSAQSISVKVYEDDPTSGPVAEQVYDIQSGDLSSTANPSFITIVLDDPVDMTAGAVYSATVEISQGDNGHILGNGIDDNDAGQSLYLGSDGNWYNWIGLTTSMRLNLDETIDVEENEHVSAVYMYPNPTSDNLTVGFVSKDGNDMTVNVLAVDGTLVASQQVVTKAGQSTTARFDMKDLASGVYMVQLLGSKSSLTQRVIVQ